MTDVLVGGFNRSLWQNATEDSDGLVWGIYLFNTPEGRTFTAAGKLDREVIDPSCTLELHGEWGTDKNNRKQFKFKNYTRQQPAGRWGNVSFISQAAGIGHTIAEQIYDIYGEESIDMLVSFPEDVAAKVPSLRAEVAIEAASYLAPIVNNMKLKLPLLDLFKGTKVSQRIADKVIEARIPDPVTTISRNPFILMQFRGVAFKAADSLRVKLKLPADMPERILGACNQAFHEVSDQTWITVKEISDKMKDLLEMSAYDALANINVLVENGSVVRSDINGVWYALVKHANYEEYVASELSRRINNEAAWPMDQIMSEICNCAAEHKEVADHQLEVLIHNLKYGGRLTILPGSPGTGKTFVLSKIIKACMESGMSVSACAPTGKAAQRLSTVLQDNGIRITATTIHRLLKPRPTAGEGFVFSEQNHEITTDVIAVDEASMVNNEIAAALFRGLAYNCHVILVGDRNQLPPVGPGTMLRDLQEKGFKEFTKIVRNAGMIVESCHQIKSGEKPRFHIQSHPGTNIKRDTNVHFVSAKKNSDKALKIAEIVKDINAGLFLSESGDPVNVLSDIQFLTVTHADADIGRKALNSYLQLQFNPSAPGDHEIFKVGDKVINTENVFLKGERFVDGEWKTFDKIFVANGDMGVVLGSEKKRILVQLASARVWAPVGESNGSWDLGNCITVHKSQGSEWKYVVLVIGDDYGSNLVSSRELFYTGLSRAKVCTIVVTSIQNVARMVGKVKIWERRSLILELMEKFNASYEDPADEDCDRQEGTDPVAVRVDDCGNGSIKEASVC